MRRSCAPHTLLIAGLLLLTAEHAAAQQSTRDTLSFLLTNQSIQTGDFVKDREAAAATRDTLSRLLLVELSTLPISSSAGGFIYKLNPALGMVERVSDSFGPFFLERAQTSGRGQTSFGFSHRYSRFTELDGRPLRDGTLVTTANRFTDEPEPFDVELLTLEMSASTFTLFANHGLTDRFDVGVAIPIVGVRLEGTRQNLYRGSLFLQAGASATATGLADVAVRGKYAVLQQRHVGLAADVDVRLPTGSEDRLLGTGKTSVRLSTIASVENGRFSAHARAGLARGGVSDEVNYGGALVMAATPKVSLIGELIGRRLDALARITESAAPHPQSVGVETIRLMPQSTGAASLMGVAGIKWNLGRTWLLSGNMLFPLSEAGLRARPTPAVSIDYTFGG